MVWSWIRLVAFDTIANPLTYLLPLLVTAWTRDKLALWGMAITFAVLHLIELSVTVEPGTIAAIELQANRVATMFNITIGATAIHLIIRMHDRLERAHRDLQAQAEQLRAQSEELAQQNEELAEQTEDPRPASTRRCSTSPLPALSCLATLPGWSPSTRTRPPARCCMRTRPPRRSLATSPRPRPRRVSPAALRRL